MSDLTTSDILKYFSFQIFCSIFYKNHCKNAVLHLNCFSNDFNLFFLFFLFILVLFFVCFIFIYLTMCSFSCFSNSCCLFLFCFFFSSKFLVFYNGNNDDDDNYVHNDDDDDAATAAAAFINDLNIKGRSVEQNKERKICQKKH